MFWKNAGKRERCSVLQRQLDREFAAAMFNTVRRQPARGADALAVSERDLVPAGRTQRAGSTNRMEFFTVDLLGSWLKP